SRLLPEPVLQTVRRRIPRGAAGFVGGALQRRRRRSPVAGGESSGERPRLASGRRPDAGLPARARPANVCPPPRERTGCAPARRGPHRVVARAADRRAGTAGEGRAGRPLRATRRTRALQACPSPP